MIFRSYARRIDGNGFFRNPREMVREFGENYVVTVHPSHVLSLYPLAVWNQIESQLQKLPMTHRLSRRLSRLVVGYAHEIDQGHGKLKIPTNLREHADLHSELAILAIGGCARLVPRKTWLEWQRDDGMPLDLWTRAPGYRDELPCTAPMEDLREARQDLERCLKQREFRRLELMIAELYGSYVDLDLVEITQFEKDGGVDLVLYGQSDGEQTVHYVQIKGGSARADVTDVRELIGVVARDSISAGILVSGSGFTDAARVEARRSRITVGLRHAPEMYRRLEMGESARVALGLEEATG